MKPYRDIIVNENEIVRIFNDSINHTELKWHRDKESRTIEAIEPTDWMVQIDNQLPLTINKIFIQAGEWHRVIKGKGNLKIRIINEIY